MSDITKRSKEFIKRSVFKFDLETTEVMIIWSLRHWMECSYTKENAKDLFSLCIEQHGLPDISVLFEEITTAIKEGSLDKGVIGSEFCNHIHYGELKCLEALYFLQNDNINAAQISLASWLKPEESRVTFKIMMALALILEKSDLIIPSRKEYQSQWRPH